MKFKGLKINVRSSKVNALLTAIANELEMVICTPTAHPVYFISDGPNYTEPSDQSYVDSYNSKGKKPIQIITTQEFINLLCEDDQAKEVYDRLSKAFEGFKTNSYMALDSYTGTCKDLVIPDTINGVANNYWCRSEFNSIVIPASFKNIYTNIFQPLKSVNLVIFKGIHHCSNGVLDDKECVVVFERTALSELPTSLKKKAAVGFAIDYYTNRSILSEFKDDYVAYIKKQKKNLIPLMYTHLDLLRFAIEQNILPQSDKAEILSKIMNVESIETYQKRLIRIGVSQDDKDDYVSEVFQDLQTK